MASRPPSPGNAGSPDSAIPPILVYLLPMVALVLGGVIASLFTSATGIQIATAAVCMALALIPAKRYDRLLEERGKTSFIITKLLT
ncbi:SoxR reducing system RseC family protein [Acutalibacter sp. JLR.KK004]|uniref:SoxR reducing system RseC family protein n=1 Tax=Acutalibacter sp. JLR.KK004 TaxID=3112622 RepID=UPI00331305FB